MCFWRVLAIFGLPLFPDSWSVTDWDRNPLARRWLAVSDRATSEDGTSPTQKVDSVDLPSSSNKKLVGTSATLLVTSALLVVTRSY